MLTLADAHGSPHHTAEAPLLLATPDNITVSAGTRLSLVCVAWGNPAPNITWTPDATAVPYQNVYTTSTTLNGLTYVVSILEVCYTEPQFSGTYSCTATNGVAAASLGGNSASFQVQAFMFQCLYSSIKSSVCLHQPRAIVHPLHAAWGVPTWYTWTINNSSAIGQAGAYILFNGSTLLIQDPLVLLTGATNVLQVQCYDQTQLISYQAYVALSEPPVVVAGPQDIITSSNLKLSAACVAWGKPPPTIAWTSSNANLTSFNTYTTTVSVGQYSYVVSILEICPTLFTTSDTYMCTASSSNGGASLGLTSSSFVFQVPNTPPSVQVVENTNLQVPCSLVGNSSVVITSVYWTDPQGSVVSNNSTLQVLGIQRNRSGVYTCTIQTTSSNSISSTTVTVLYPPSVFTIGEQTVYIRQGLPVTLSYSFVGLPVPNVTWSGPSGQQIQSNSQFTVRTSSNFTQLTINSLNGSDTGNYTCIASNYLGLSSLSTAVYVQVPPNPPTNLIVTDRAASTISLSWSNGFNGNSPLVNVSISYESPNYIGVEGTMYLILPEVYSATLSGLHPNANYSIHVALLNAAGFTSTSTTVLTSTLSLRLMAPSITTLYASSSVQLVMTWTITTDATMAPPDSWIVEYTPSGGSPTNVTVPGSLRIFILTGLSRGTLYSVRLAGVNVAGLGPFSSYVVNTTTIDAPSVPLNLITTVLNLTSIVVSWAPPLDNGGRIILYYQIQYRVVGGSNFTLVTQIYDLQYTIMDLAYDTIYELQVVAFNGFYFSTPTPSVQQKIQPQGVLPPDPPSNITVTNQNATSISLSWNTGFDGNSPLVNVSISYWSPNYPNDGTQYVLLPLVYSATLSGLHPNANYSIRITLVNAVGITSTLVVIASSTISLTFAAPIISALYAVSSTQLVVRWMITADATMAPADSWIVEYTPSGGSPTNVTVPGSLRIFTLTGLSRGTLYSVRLAGVNVAGLGPFSSYVVNTTTIDAPSVPEIQSALPVNSTAINVSWSPPLDNGGRSIQYYVIQIRVLGGGGSFTSVGQVLALQYVITAGLQDSTIYEVRVTAFNGGLFGIPSLAQVTTPPIGPPFPLNVMPQVYGTTDTTAVVTWISPGGYIDNYTLQYKPSDQTWNGAITYTVGTAATIFTITGLISNTSYDIQVRTNNKNSSSAFAAQSFITLAPPTVKVIGPVSAVSVGNTVALACVVESGYNSTVSWSRADGASLPPGTSAKGNLLLFTSVQVQTSGIYVCTFAGSAGPISEAFSLNVSDVPLLPTSSQPTLPSVIPTSSGAFPVQLVITASLGAGIPLFCIGLALAACFILIFQYYFRVKRRNRVDNPLYNTVALPNTLTLDGTRAPVAEIPFKGDDLADYTSVF
ncbi:hypothetical protein EMCRGX_G015449 [Ephydatia muelleri]